MILENPQICLEAKSIDLLRSNAKVYSHDTIKFDKMRVL